MNKLLIYTDPMDLANKATDWLSGMVSQHKASSVYLPAGRSPEPLYQYWNEHHPDFLDALRFHQIDEIQTGEKKDSFRQFFESHLPKYRNQFRWVNEGGVQADLSILGFGINGHVAFHEPNVSQDWFWGDVILSKETCEYLSIESGAIGKTYGLKAFLASKGILLIVAGFQKKRAFEAFMKGDTSLPVTALKKHSNLTVLVESRILEP